MQTFKNLYLSIKGKLLRGREVEAPRLSGWPSGGPLTFLPPFPFLQIRGKKSKQQQQTTNTPYFPVSQKNQFDSQCDSTNLIFTSLVYSPQLIDRCLALQPEIEMYRSEGSQVLGFGCKFLAFLWAISLLCILFPLLLAKEGGLRCFYPFWGWQNSF